VRKVLRMYRGQCVSYTCLAAKYKVTDLIIWPCTVASPRSICLLMFKTQNDSKLRDSQCNLHLQQAISEAKVQKEWNLQQGQNGLLRVNGAALYEQHDVPPSSYTTEPRHRAFVNGSATK
jgi:hypothetical protein